MRSTEELKERLGKAREIEDILDRRLQVLAIITEYLSPKGVRPVLVGGAAVELYTVGGYATSDLDVIVNSSTAMAEAMRDLGFDKSGRFWVRDDIEIVLETPTGPLAGDPNRVVEIDVGGMVVYVIGVEDLVIDRLNAFVHWGSSEDGRWAARLLSAQDADLDWDYLRRRAHEEKVDQALADIRESLAGSNDEKD